ncbi:MCE family protein [bacterium]|nr:MCE family protein [bacterium]
MTKEAKIGAIIILAAVLLFLLAPSSRTRDSSLLSDKYNLIFVKAPGLQEGSSVKMAGVSIGEVEAIDFCTAKEREQFGEDAFLIIRIVTDFHTKIPEDSSASALRASTGGSWLEITPGISKKNLQKNCTVRLLAPFAGIDLQKSALSSMKSFRENANSLCKMIIEARDNRTMWDLASNSRFYSNEIRIASRNSHQFIMQTQQKINEGGKNAEMEIKRLDVQLIQIGTKLKQIAETLNDKSKGWEEKSEEVRLKADKLARLAADETERFKNISLKIENKTESVCNPALKEKLAKAAKKLDSYAEMAEDLHYITKEPETQEAIKQMIVNYKNQSEEIKNMLDKL